MFTQTFKKIGLNAAQADILDFLIRKGDQKASTVSKELKRARGVVYKELDELVQNGLVEKVDREGTATVFRSVHPEEISHYFEKKKQGIQREQKILERALPELISSFNLSSPQAKVKYLEGEEGFRECAFDTLTPAKEILAFIDSKSVLTSPFTKKVNQEYIEERVEKKIMKKSIIPKNARRFFKVGSWSKEYKKYTQVRVLDGNFSNFNSSIQIYGDKISFFNLEKDKNMGMVIEEKNISLVLTKIFYQLWDKIPPKDIIL